MTKKDYWNKYYLKNPINFIFGYGSTINRYSSLQTNNNIGDGIPVRISKKFGFRRTWNFKNINSQFTAVGLEKNKKKNTTINGVIYPIYSNIHKFDNREEGYYRTLIPFEFIQSLTWVNIPKHDCKIWVYIPKKCNVSYPTNTHPILQSYLDLCLEGCLKYNSEFAHEFLETTFHFSKYWLNDRELARRPWIYQNNYKELDYLLSNYPQKNNCFKHIKLPVEYSIYFLHNIINSKEIKF